MLFPPGIGWVLTMAFFLQCWRTTWKISIMLNVFTFDETLCYTVYLPNILIPVWKQLATNLCLVFSVGLVPSGTVK